MLVRVKATVEGVGEAEELADIGRAHRIGAVIGALMEEIELGHPGVPLSLVYPEGGEPRVLPQLLTPAIVIESLEP